MKNSLRSRICKLVKRLSDSININPRNKHKMLNIDSLLSQTCVQVEPVLSTTPLHTSITPPPLLLLLPLSFSSLCLEDEEKRETREDARSNKFMSQPFIQLNRPPYLFFYSPLS